MQSQQSTAGEDALSLDTETSSPRMIAVEAQPVSQSAELFASQDQHSDAFPSAQAAKDKQQHSNVRSSAELRRHESGLSVESLGSAKGSGRIKGALGSRQSDPDAVNTSADAEQLASHEQTATCCSFSPNGQNLATASADGVVRISAPASLQVLPLIHNDSNAMIDWLLACLLAWLTD